MRSAVFEHPHAPVRRGRTTTRARWQDWAILVLAPSFLILPTVMIGSIWVEARALQRAWKVEGPPCPQVDRPSSRALSRHRPPMTFTYGEASFTRSFAAVDCAAVPKSAYWPREAYRVCQFNNPGAITVLTAAGRHTFEPPPGARATVTVRDGAVICVVGGSFNL